jgi:hypothetical protein
MALAAHVERLVVTLSVVGVVAECGVELQPRVEQRFVRHLELLLIVLGPAAAVQVVTHHQNELVGELRARRNQHLRHFVLRRRSGAAVANDREFQGVGLVRQRHVLRRGRADRADEQRQRNHESSV